MSGYTEKILSRFEGMDKEDKVISVFELVRDLPYGVIHSRDPRKVWQKRKGTCSGKHFLLSDLFEGLGLETKNCNIEINIDRSHPYEVDVEYPDILKNLLREPIKDYHNFLMVKTNGGTIVDATYDAQMKKYGFPVNENWDGKSDMLVLGMDLDSNNITKPESPLEYKKRKVASLPDEMRKRRRKYLREFSRWLKQLRDRGV